MQAAAQNEDKLREIMEKELHDNLTMLREIFLEADVRKAQSSAFLRRLLLTAE